MVRAKDIPQYGGWHLRRPGLSEIPGLPHFPKLPHVNHGRGILLLAGILAGSAVVASTTAEKDIVIATNTVPGETDDIMSYPYGKAVRISIDRYGGEVIDFTNEPQVLKAESFANSNIGDAVPFWDNDPKSHGYNEISKDDLRDDLFVPFFGSGNRDFSFAVDNQLRGDIWLMLVNSQGEPIDSSGRVLGIEEYPLYTRTEFVNLALPQSK